MKAIVYKLAAITLLVTIFSTGAINDGFFPNKVADPVTMDAENQPNNQNNGYSDITSVLTIDGAINIALMNEEINQFVMETDASSEARFDGISMWIIDFLPSDDTVFLEAYVDDVEQILIDYYYSDNYNDVSYVDPILESAVIDFVKSYDLTSEFFVQYPNMELEVFSSDGEYINVWGFDLIDTWISIDIHAIEKSTNVWELTIDTVNANSIFGYPKHDFDGIISLISDIPEVKNFISNNTNYILDITLSLFNEKYSSTENLNIGYFYTISYYSGEKMDFEVSYDNIGDDSVSYSWLSIFVDDLSGDILELYAPLPAQMSESQVIDIVLDLQEIDTLVSTSTEYYIYATYDNIGLWLVEYYDEIGNYASITVDDLTGEILELYVMSPKDAIKTEDEIIGIVLDLEEIVTFLENMSEYDIFAYYDGYGVWWIDVYFTNYFDFAFVEIDDLTGDVLYIEVYKTDPATMNESDVITIAMNNGFEDFMNTYPDAELDYMYDGFAWYVVAYHPNYIEAYAFMSIEDTSGDIIYSEFNYLSELPDMTVVEVLNLVHQSSNYTDFINTNTVIEEYVYYFQGVWIVELFAENAENFVNLIFEVDDLSGQILEIYSMSDCLCEAQSFP